MNDPHLATREVLWNISHAWVMYALLLPTVAAAGYGVYRRVRIWRRGQAEDRWDRPRERVMLVVKNAILQNSSGAIMQVVKSDAHAISFDSFGYVNSSVKALAVDGIAATAENARSGSYPVVRPLYFLTKTQPTGLVKAFLDYCDGPDAQKIIAGEGYISVH